MEARQGKPAMRKARFRGPGGSYCRVGLGARSAMHSSTGPEPMILEGRNSAATWQEMMVPGSRALHSRVEAGDSAPAPS